MMRSAFDMPVNIPEPTSSRSDRVLVDDGVFLHTNEYGEGSLTVFLIHGLGDASYVWTEIVSVLSQRFRVVTLDLRGHGKSNWSIDGNYDLELFVRDLIKVISQKSLGPYAIIGHSLGAQIALSFSMSNPQNCLSVIAVEPALSTPLNVITLIKKHLHDGVDGFANRDSFLRHLQDSRPTLSATWRYRLVEHALCSSPDGRLHYTFDPIVLQLKTRNSHAADPCFTKWLELIETPLLLLRGEASAVLPYADARLIATHVPQCKFATIKQAGHSVIMENPIGVLDQILPFLAELIGSPSPDDCEDIA